MSTHKEAVMANELRISCSYDGEWFFVGRLAVYPREDGTFSIGKPDSPGTWRDVETGFENIDAAYDHAVWMETERLAA